MLIYATAEIMNDSPGLLAKISTQIGSIESQLKSLTDQLKGVRQTLSKLQTNNPVRSLSGTSKRLRSESSDDEVDDVKQFKSDSDANVQFKMDEDGNVIVYTDGACENNGRSNAKAGIGVWFGAEHPLNVSEPVRGKATNNVGEIQACTSAIRAANSNGVTKLNIHTDSQFVINSMTKWIHGWKKKNWRLADGGPVKNKDDFEKLDAAMKLIDVKFTYVPGHRGVVGNEAADHLAKNGAARYKNLG